MATKNFKKTGILYCIKSDATPSITHTGNTSETTLKTIVVPANSMGPNGFCIVRVAGQHTNDASNKTYRVRFGGTSVGSAVVTTSATGVWEFYISNVNATNSQKCSPPGGVDSSSSAVLTTAAIDTTQDVTILIQGTLADAADSIAVADVKVLCCYAD